MLYPDGLDIKTLIALTQLDDALRDEWGKAWDDLSDEQQFISACVAFNTYEVEPLNKDHTNVSSLPIPARVRMQTTDLLGGK